MTTAPRLTIDLGALARNWQALNALSPQSETAAVVKANAYGLGIETVVPVLAEAGCQTFFVAMVEEGRRVRECLPHANIFVLNGIFPETVSDAVRHHLYPVLSTLEQVRMWSQAQNATGCALHFDTGMNRLGMTLEEAQEMAEDQALLADCNPRLLMSHFACADEPNHPLNQEQRLRFEAFSALFPEVSRSLANSAAVIADPSSHFDVTRPGVAIYGGEAVNNLANPMEAVVKAETRILQIRSASKGETVGYGAAVTLQRDSKIAICSAGYADGYHRSSSGSGVPLRSSGPAGGVGALDGHIVPLLGRVSMDLTAFDITDIPAEKLAKSDWIELFGQHVTLDDAARAAGTIGYELLTGLGQRYQRVYVGRDGQG